MFKFNTKAELITSSQLLVGVIYAAPQHFEHFDPEDTNFNKRFSGLKLWEVKEGAPFDGNIINFAETCTGINNAYVQNISGSFANFNGDHRNVTVAPVGTLYYNAQSDDFYTFNSASWRKLAIDYD